MTDIATLMRRNLLDVFGERDAAARAAAIAEIYTTDVAFADPDEVVTGHAAVDAKAQGLLDGAPGFVFSEAGPVYVVADLGSLAWNFGPAGGEPVVSGTDVAIIRDGRIASLYTYLTAR